MGYSLALRWLGLRWQDIPSFSKPDYTGKIQFSVLIPVRNEGKNLAKLLESLVDQEYPKRAFEVLVINDSSTDDTQEIVEDFEARKLLPLRLLHLRPDPKRVAHKKAALELGVSRARFPLILTTDGDCVLPKGWLASFAGFYEQHRSVLISGGVTFKPYASLFSKLQTVEFASLVGTGGTLLSAGFPTMANGANLCYEKAAFEAVGGFSGNRSIPSGDDEFLLRKLAQAFPKRVHFLKSPQAVVRTTPPVSLSAFVAQRRRWASKWNAHQDKGTALLAILVFCFHLLHLAALGYFFLTGNLYLLACLFLKLSVEFGLLRKWLLFLGQPRTLRWIPLTQMLYSFYAVYFGLTAHKKSYAWKGRSFRKR